MKKLSKLLISLIMPLLIAGVLPVQAQEASPPKLLTLPGPNGFPVIPVMEGWAANADGTTSYSFGFINRNMEGPVDIPLGENNYIEPAQFDGMQPTHFDPGHSVGAFSVTVPANMKDVDVWWHIVTDGEDLKVPGRSTTAPYEIDFIRPRPQGSLQPLVGFGEIGERSAGLLARVEDYPGRVAAGDSVTLTVNAMDPSDRDPTDPRFGEPLPVRLVWMQHQGPGKIEFSRHESSPALEEEEPGGRISNRRVAKYDPALTSAETVTLPLGQGVARINAVFSEPGEYIVRTRVDNFSASDSSLGDQCCWSNVLQRVTVTP
jgi:hypothetical protein